MNHNILFPILCLFIGFVLAYFFLGRDFSSVHNVKRLVSIDTVIKEIRSEPIVLTKVVPKITYVHDTIYSSMPYKAVLDTILRSDTIKAEYRFPENLLSLRISTQADTLTYFNTKTIDLYAKEENWWEIPSYILGGIALGYLIGDSK